MMKSAIDWLMGKSSAVTENNGQLISSLHINADSVPINFDQDSSKENSLLNGNYSDNMEATSELPERRQRLSDEEARSPWGRTLTPKSPKYVIENGSKRSQMSSTFRISNTLPSRNKLSMSWEDMSFASEVTSPGFVTRIAKEGRVKKQLYDGSRKYPIGQDKFICAGILPNVRLKGKKKPVVLSRRAPTSPLLPLASSTSPFSSKITPGFLASASTRMPDISSVASVFDSLPSSLPSESIKDPTSVHAVVAALEQAQNLKSGVKRSRFMEPEDSNKKQKCVNNGSQSCISTYATPVGNKNFNAGIGGEKRALDSSPPSFTECSSTEKAQLSPENKRRCIPDPRVASFSSSKTITNNRLNVSESGRESPFFMYESHQDSDSESNKSLDSHPSRQSERSFQGQNIDLSSGGISNHEAFNRSGSQTPQSQRGSYCVSGLSNGSSSSSRTTTPSRPSHAFSLEAYKADKAKSQQRLNKMLGMLFNVSDEEVVASLEAQKLNIPSFGSSKTLSNTTLFPTLIEPISSTISPQVPTTSTSLSVQPSVENSSSTNDISTSYTFTIKSPASSIKNKVDKLPTVSEESNIITLASILAQPDTTDASNSGETKAAALSKGTSLTDLLSKGHTLTNSIAAAYALPQIERFQKETLPISKVKSYLGEPVKFDLTTSKSSSLDIPSTEQNNGIPSKPQNTFSFSSQEKVAPSKIIGETTLTNVASPSITSSASNLMPAIFSFDSTSKEANNSEVTNAGSLPSMSTELFPIHTSNANATSGTLTTSKSSASTSLFSFGGNKVDTPSSDNMLADQLKSNQPPVSSFSFVSQEPKNTSISASDNTNSGLSIFNFQPTSVTSSSSPVAVGPFPLGNSNGLNCSTQPAFNFGQSFSYSNDSGTTAKTAGIPSTAVSDGIFSFGNSTTTKSNDKQLGTLQGSPFTFGSSQPISAPNQPSFANSGSTNTAPVFGSGGGGFSFAPKVTAATKSLPTASVAFSFGSTCTSSTSSSGFSFNPISSSQPFNFSSTTKNATIPTATTSSSSIFSFGNGVNAKPATPGSFGSFDESNTSATTSGFSFSSQKLAESTPSFGSPLPTFTASSNDKNVSKSIFGASDSKAPPSYASNVSSSFNPTSASNLFGSGSSSTFAAKVNSTNLFGASSSTFGSTVPSNGASNTFGSSNAALPTYGSAVPSTGASNTFGSSNASLPTFGSTVPTTGASNAFGSSNAAPPTFGSSNTALFGSQNVPSFAPPNNGGAPAFGTSTNSFGSPASVPNAKFGSTNAPTFGSNSANAPLLADSSNSSFGSTKAASFGTASANAFSFGSGAASPTPAPGIFQFGSAGSVPTMPNFNSVVPTTPGDASASVVRRPKARAHRRR